MVLKADTVPGGLVRAVTVRSGLWPTILALLLAAGQESAPTAAPPAPVAPAPAAPATAPAATATPAPETVPPAKEGEGAKDGKATATEPQRSVPPTSPASASTNAGQKAEPAQKIVPWEYNPYKIHVWLTAVPSPEISEDLLAGLRGELARRAEVVVGAPWSMTVTAPPAGLHYTVAMCPKLLTDTAIGVVEKDRLKDDKLILVNIAASPWECRIWTREFDCHARIWGPEIVRIERQPAAMSNTVFAAVLAAFGPLARIEDGQGKACVVRGRATGLITTPNSPAQLEKGDVLQPIFRQNDRYGNPLPGKAEAIAFTFLHVTSADPESPSLLNCNVHSGMSSPIRGRSMSTSRRERWAIKVRPSFPVSDLLVESKPAKRNELKIALSGVEVFSKTPEPEVIVEQSEEEKQIAEKKNPPEFLGVTDWRGSLPVQKGGPTLRILYLKNGGLLMARLPVVPGLDERLLAEVADDNPRLQAEGFVKGMNSEVTDLVVQRQLIAVRMRKKIKEGKLDDAEKLFEEFRGLKTLNDLQQMLNVQLKRQKTTNSPAVRQKIDKLYGDERELLAKYIDAELQVKLLAELTQARANPAPPPADEDAKPDVGSAAGSEKSAESPEASKAKDAPAPAAK